MILSRLSRSLSRSSSRVISGNYKTLLPKQPIFPPGNACLSRAHGGLGLVRNYLTSVGATKQVVFGSSTVVPNLTLFWHINQGIKEILADYVHQEVTRTWILIYLRLFLLIAVKDVFVALYD